MMRNRTIDIVRGVSIIAIVIGHLGVSAINRVVFTFHVPIFFIITGYFMSSGLLCPFIKKKARTLLIPYAVTCIVMIVLGCVIALLRGGDAWQAVKDWTRASLYGSGNNYTSPFPIKQIGAIWFLWASFWGSIALRVSLQWKSVVRLMWVAGLFALGYLSARYLFWFPLSIQAGCCAVLYMYLGYCLRQSQDTITSLPNEIKLAGTALAFVVWISFIAHFKSFWLVRCNFGRGIEDIVSSLCACYCVLIICRIIDRSNTRIADAFAFLGRYSIIVLCVHITELNMIEWRSLVGVITSIGIPDLIGKGIAVGLKMLLIIGSTFLLTKSRIVRNVFSV